MAKVEIMSDVMVPLAVTAANVGAVAYDVRNNKTGWRAASTSIAMIGTIGGYIGQIMSKKESQAKIFNRLAVASFPAAGVAIYSWIKEATAAPTGASARVGRSVQVQADPLLQYKTGGI